MILEVRAVLQALLGLPRTWCWAEQACGSQGRGATQQDCSPASLGRAFARMRFSLGACAPSFPSLSCSPLALGSCVWASWQSLEHSLVPLGTYSGSGLRQNCKCAGPNTEGPQPGHQGCGGECPRDRARRDSICFHPGCICDMQDLV